MVACCAEGSSVGLARLLGGRRAKDDLQVVVPVQVSIMSVILHAAVREVLLHTKISRLQMQANISQTLKRGDSPGKRKPMTRAKRRDEQLEKLVPGWRQGDLKRSGMIIQISRVRMHIILALRSGSASLSPSGYCHLISSHRDNFLKLTLDSTLRLFNRFIPSHSPQDPRWKGGEPWSDNYITFLCVQIRMTLNSENCRQPRSRKLMHRNNWTRGNWGIKPGSHLHPALNLP